MLITATSWVSQDPSNRPASASRNLYFKLLQETGSPQTAQKARAYPYERLEEIEALDCDLPQDPQDIHGWIQANTTAVGQHYQAYLAGRRQGAPRRYFHAKSHALHFLKGVAPTKLVDGAWLYGLTPSWQDARFTELIRIYLEELGEGDPDKNHVVIYKKLLAANGCEHWDALDDEHYVQGAIQLALAQHAAEFLPEVIGFNLGYEQLPLHLLISAYELNELGIDPYYFTLHVTVDNAATGHAQRALRALQDAIPKTADPGEFYRRVRQGYMLNMLGASTLSVINDFDLDEEILRILASKSSIGSQLHSDYCRVAGRTVNQWLSDPAQLPDFLGSLEKAGWILRNRNPEESRFWKLIQGEQAQMFGVFDAYERQVIHDWIAGDFLNEQRGQLNYRARKRLLDTIAKRPAAESGNASEAGSGTRPHASQGSDFDIELRQFEEKLASLPSNEEIMRALLPMLSPARHHTAVGLMATRIYTRLFQLS